MEVKKIESNDDLKLELSGRIDTQTVSNLHDEIQDIDFNSYKSVIIDIKNVEYISSAGLREFLIIRKNISNPNSLKIVNSNSSVMEVFKMTGFDGMLNISMADETDKSIYTKMSFKELLAYKSDLEKTNGERELLFDSQGYSWTDIEKCSQIVASDLSKLGVKKGSHVGLMSLNSANWIITFFAISKLGGIAQLINSNLKDSEVAGLSDCADMTHLCIGDLANGIEAQEFIKLVKANPENKIEEFYFMNKDINYKDRYKEYPDLVGKFDTKVECDDPALMIFSSGSTGKPKAVLCSGYNIMVPTALEIETFHVTKDDKMCLILPLFHCFGLSRCLFTCLVSDAKIYMPENLKTATIISLIDKEKCTMFHSVPTMMLAIVNNKDFTKEKLSTLRFTVLAGAATSKAQMQMLRELLPNDHFVNSYGLSEVAPVTTTKYEDSEKHILETVGHPVEFVKVKIRELASGNDYEVGPTPEGEILVNGSNLMVCYYKLAIDDQAVDEKGWLHTGDLGRLDEDGYLRITGRLKEIIIRGGENIIPNEIAAAISTNEDIADVKVVGVPDDFYGEVVGAAIVMKNGKTFNEDMMKEFLQDKIAKYKIPQYFVVYDAFPLLSNGKVDAVNLKKDVIEKIKN